MVPAGLALHEDQTSPRPFRLAQTLLLKKRFSALPPFALIAAAALASVVAVFMAFEPYETPTGLAVRLLPIGSLDGDRLSPRPVVIAIVAGANGSPVIRVNCRETPPNNLEDATRRELKVLAEPRVYVEAESTVAWADVTSVIDMTEGLNAEVVLLTATPDTSSKHTAIRKTIPRDVALVGEIPISARSRNRILKTRLTPLAGRQRYRRVLRSRLRVALVMDHESPITRYAPSSRAALRPPSPLRTGHGGSTLLPVDRHDWPQGKAAPTFADRRDGCDPEEIGGSSSCDAHYRLNRVVYTEPHPISFTLQRFHLFINAVGNSR
jgi:hypothetical protein